MFPVRDRVGSDFPEKLVDIPAHVPWNERDMVSNLHSEAGDRDIP
jgi:hypothetical protein